MEPQPTEEILNKFVRNLGVAVLVGGAAAAAPSPGQEAGKSNVPVVESSEAPGEEVRLQAKELWRRGGEDDDVLFGLVAGLVTDHDGNIYVLDGQLSTIHVFSPTGEHLRQIGREGEGPGEFRNASDLFLGPGNTLGVVQVFPGRIVKLGLDGTPAGNFALPEVAGGGFQLVFVGRGLPDRVVLAGAQQHMQDGKQNQVSYLTAFDPQGKQIARYHEENAETRFGGMKFVEKTFSNFQRRWALAPDGRVASALTYDDYRITLWNPDGSPNRVIDRPKYTPLARTGEIKKRFQKFFDSITRWNPGSTFEVSPTHAAVADLRFTEDGSLWVLSGRGMWEHEPGVFASYDVYDKQGRFVRRTHILLDGDAGEDGVFFAGNRLYRVTDLFGAAIAAFSSGGTGGETEQPESDPVTLIAYELGPSGAGKTGAAAAKR